MTTSWKDYLLKHANNIDYNCASKEIANIAKKLDKPEEIFNLLHDVPDIILASRSAVDNIVQAFFHFCSQGKRILKAKV